MSSVHLRWRHLLVLLTGIAGGCAEASERAAPRISNAGDTLVVRSPVSPDTIAAGAAEVIYRAPALEYPRNLAFLTNQLIVADWQFLHALTTDGEAVLLGRGGKGPGEFTFIEAAAAVDDRSFVVLDVGLMRLTFWSAHHEVITTVPVQPLLPYVSGSSERRILVIVSGAALFLSSGLYQANGPRYLGLISIDLANGRTTLIREWPDIPFQNLSRAESGPITAYDPKAIVAVSEEGNLAHGNGVEYCVDVEPLSLSNAEAAGSLTRDNRLMRICRNHSPIAPGREFRKPDLSIVSNARGRQYLEDNLSRIGIPDMLPAYDRLVWDSQGRLWVRTLGKEMADIHPLVLRAEPHLLSPQYRYWDVFSSVGEILGTVRLPGLLEVDAIRDDRIYGFVRASTDERYVVSLIYELESTTNGVALRARQ